MKKTELIETTNALIKTHDLDFDPATDDMKVADLKDLMSDVQDAVPAEEAPSFTVAALCKDAGRDPKTIRAKLRRMYAKDDCELPQPIEGASQRWTFDEEHRDAITALISND